MNKKGFILFIFFVAALQLRAVNVVFRLDDPRLRYDSVSDRVVQLFNDKQVPLSIAVVPCDKQEQVILPCTTQDSLYVSLLQQNNIELALHGLTHEDINQQGEFGGLTYQEAAERIRIGGGILRECTSQKISTFIPPFNAYNDSTLVAIQDNGLHIISADMFGVASNHNVQYYPETLGHLMARKGIWQAAEEAIFGCKQKDAICVVMFHAYDLPDEASWERLANLLDACKADERVQLHTFQSLYESGEYASHHRYRANKLHSLLQKYCLHEGVLHTTWLCWLVHLLNALLYALVVWGMLLAMVLVRTKRLATPYRNIKKSGIIAVVGVSLVFLVLALLQVGSPLKLMAVDVVVSAGVAMLVR